MGSGAVAGVAVTDTGLTREGGAVVGPGIQAGSCGRCSYLSWWWSRETSMGSSGLQVLWVLSVLFRCKDCNKVWVIIEGLFWGCWQYPQMP